MSWHRYHATDRHSQLGFDGTPNVNSVPFDDRAACVRYARQRSESGTPCDAYDNQGNGEPIYTREMDIAAARAQRGLFT